MKLVVRAGLILLILSGCSMNQVRWQQDNHANLDGVLMQMDSQLWSDQMPGIVQEDRAGVVHGSLRLVTSSALSDDVKVSRVVIQQGAVQWTIHGDQVKLQAVSDTLWEVIFSWQMSLDVDKSVNVAVEVDNGQHKQWLVQHRVMIEKVY